MTTIDSTLASSVQNVLFALTHLLVIVITVMSVISTPFLCPSANVLCFFFSLKRDFAEFRLSSKRTWVLLLSPFSSVPEDKSASSPYGSQRQESYFCQLRRNAGRRRNGARIWGAKSIFERVAQPN